MTIVSFIDAAEKRTSAHVQDEDAQVKLRARAFADEVADDPVAIIALMHAGAMLIASLASDAADPFACATQMLSEHAQDALELLSLVTAMRGDHVQS